ncbi:MAG: hypothetical protein WKG01_24425 [Kofleriaceae bacterium]
MSKSKPATSDPFQSIDLTALDRVSGGAARVTARSGGADDAVMQALTAITSSIKDLASSQGSGMDPMMMMMMMMMRGGGGGGAAAPAQSAPPVPQINITTDVKRRC